MYKIVHFYITFFVHSYITINIKYYSCIKELNIDKNKLYFLQTKEYDNENDNKQWILILYDISQNHYVGVPVYNEEKENSIH